MTTEKLIVVAFLSGIVSVALADLVSEEIRGRLDRIPLSLIRMAGRRLAADIRDSTTDEWLAELQAILLRRGATPLPVTRLVIGIRYAIGLLRSTKIISSELSALPRREPAYAVVYHSLAALQLRPRGVLPSAAAAASLIIGYIGLQQFTEYNSDFGHRAVDTLYYDLQLLILGSDPLQAPGPYPLALQIARFLAPAATLCVLVNALRALLEDHVKTPQHWRVLPLAAAATGATTLIIGYIGLDKFTSGNPAFGQSSIDIISYDLQLLVLGADPLQAPGPYPLTLDIARFAAPGLAGYFTLRTISLLLNAGRGITRPWLAIPTTLTAISTLLGFIGLNQRHLEPDFGQRVIDTVYYDLQLFVLGSDPLQAPGPYPLALDIARFLAPITVVYTAVRVLRPFSSIDAQPIRRWVIFPATAAAASITMGFVGLREFTGGSADFGHRTVDTFYYDLQLFTLGADPLQSPGPYPLLLQTARFLAPTVSVYVLASLVVLLIKINKGRAESEPEPGPRPQAGN